MNLSINGVNVDFKLEDEECIGEVVTSLDRWSVSEKFTIQQILIDGREIALDRRSDWEGQDLNAIDRIEVLGSTEIESASDDLATLISYFSLFSEAVKSDDRGKITECAEEFPFTQNRLKDFVPQWDSAIFLGEVTYCLENYSDSLELLKSIDNRLEDLLARLRQLRLEIMNPFEAKRAIVAELSSYEEAMGEVSLLLQSGEAPKAMAILNRFLDLFSAFLRLSDDGESEVKEFVNDIRPILDDLAEAMEKNDIVFTGDLIEYELAPRIAPIVDILQRGV